MSDLLQAIQSSDVMVRLGWTLLHSLWLGAGVAAGLALVLAMLRRSGPLVRYGAACAALVALLAGMAWTFCVIPARAEAPRGQGNVRAMGEVAPAALPAGSFVTEPVANHGRAVASVAAEPRAAVVAAAVPEPLAGRAEKILEPVIPWVNLGWTVGVLILSVWQLSAWVAMRRLCVVATRNVERPILAAVERLRNRLGIGRTVKVMRSMLAQVPMTIGWARPVILLPASLATGLSAGQLEMLLVHELAHIRRMDYLVNLGQTVIETLLFYHPAVWYIGRQIRAERENCCDDVVVAVCGDREEYAQVLVACRGAAGRMALAASGGKLLPRLRRILGVSGEGPGRSVLWSAGVALVLVTGLVLIPVAVSCAGLHDKGGLPARTEDKGANADEWHHDLFPICDQGKWGFIDGKGRVVIEPAYEAASYFSEGLAAVRVNNKYGYIDATGRMVIQPRFAFGFGFREGLAWVSGEPGGFIDKTGKIVIPEPWSGTCSEFRDGLALVRPFIGREPRGQFWFMDKSGKDAFKRQFEDAWDFREGLAAVSVGRKWGFIDKTGRMVIEPRYDSPSYFFEGLANVTQGSKAFFIDKTGKRAFAREFEDANPFAEGLAGVKIVGKWGFIDKTGEVVIAPQFESVSTFFSGRAAVTVKGKYGYIDRSGKVVVEPAYAYGHFFLGDLAGVSVEPTRSDGANTEYIDRDGHVIWRPRAVSAATMPAKAATTTPAAATKPAAIAPLDLELRITPAGEGMFYNLDLLRKADYSVMQTIHLRNGSDPSEDGRAFMKTDGANRTFLCVLGSIPADGKQGQWYKLWIFDPKQGQFVWVRNTNPGEGLDLSVPDKPATSPATTPAGTIPAKAATTAPAVAPKAPPYTDEEAVKFAAKLPEVTYPSTIEAACKTLGVDASRLEMVRLVQWGGEGLVIQGAGFAGKPPEGPGVAYAPLSPTYGISFHFNQYNVTYKLVTIDKVVAPKAPPATRPATAPAAAALKVGAVGATVVKGDKREKDGVVGVLAKKADAGKVAEWFAAGKGDPASDVPVLIVATRWVNRPEDTFQISAVERDGETLRVTLRIMEHVGIGVADQEGVVCYSYAELPELPAGSYKLEIHYLFGRRTKTGEETWGGDRGGWEPQDLQGTWKVARARKTTGAGA